MNALLTIFSIITQPSLAFVLIMVVLTIGWFLIGLKRGIADDFLSFSTALMTTITIVLGFMYVVGLGELNEVQMKEKVEFFTTNIEDSNLNYQVRKKDNLLKRDDVFITIDRTLNELNQKENQSDLNEVLLFDELLGHEIFIEYQESYIKIKDLKMSLGNQFLMINDEYAYLTILKNSTKVVYSNIPKNKTSEIMKKELLLLGYEIKPLTIQNIELEKLKNATTYLNRAIVNDYVLYLEDSPFKDNAIYEEFMKLLEKHYGNYPFSIYNGHSITESYEIEDELDNFYNITD